MAGRTAGIEHMETLLCVSLLGPLLLACGNSKEVPRKAEHPFEVEASVQPNPRMVVSALVTVRTDQGARVWVEHGETEALGDRTSEASVPSNGSVEIPIVGLTPNRLNHIRVHATSGQGIAATRDLTFTAGPLPPGVPESLPVQVNTNEATGYVLTGLTDPAIASFVATVIDRRGRIRWYWVAPKPAEAAAQFDRTPRGTFVVALGFANVAYELDLGGRMLSAWRYRSKDEGINSHDFVLLPNGNALMGGFEHHVADSRAVFPGGVGAAIRTDQTVDEMNALGDIVSHWSTFEHIDVPEVVPGPEFDATRFETGHLNSIEVLPDGNLVVSLRATNSILKINRSDGSVMWRLGGKKSDFAIREDPLGGFSRQHDARALANGDILLFDNGAERKPEVSRVVSYHLDEARHTATLTWAYRHDPDVFSKIRGSARRLPNGNTLVAFSPSLITEVDSGKRVVWESRIRPFEVYRAIFVPSLYPVMSALH